MSYIEQHIVDHCKTAADVMAAAFRVKQFRARLREPVVHRNIKPVEIEKQPTKQEILEPIRTDHPLLKLIEEARFIEPQAFKIYPTVKEIQRAVAALWKISIRELLCQRRTTSIVVPRQVCYALAKLLTDHSLPQIGKFMAGRDHTTVLHGIRKYEWLTEILHRDKWDERSLAECAARAYQLILERR